MANEKNRSNPLVAGAVLAGVAVTAAVLSKKENRDKAAKMMKDAVKSGEKFMKKPEIKAATGAMATKVLDNVKSNVEKNAGQPQNGNARKEAKKA